MAGYPTLQEDSEYKRKDEQKAKIISYKDI